MHSVINIPCCYSLLSKYHCSNHDITNVVSTEDTMEEGGTAVAATASAVSNANEQEDSRDPQELLVPCRNPSVRNPPHVPSVARAATATAAAGSNEQDDSESEDIQDLLVSHDTSVAAAAANVHKESELEMKNRKARQRHDNFWDKMPTFSECVKSDDADDKKPAPVKESMRKRGSAATKSSSEPTRRSARDIKRPNYRESPERSHHKAQETPQGAKKKAETEEKKKKAEKSEEKTEKATRLRNLTKMERKEMMRVIELEIKAAGGPEKWAEQNALEPVKPWPTPDDIAAVDGLTKEEIKKLSYWAKRKLLSQVGLAVGDYPIGDEPTGLTAKDLWYHRLLNFKQYKTGKRICIVCVMNQSISMLLLKKRTCVCLLSKHRPQGL